MSAPEAPQVEHPPRKREVAGSTPAGGSIADRASASGSTGGAASAPSSPGPVPDSATLDDLQQLGLTVRAYNILDHGGYLRASAIRAASDAELVRLFMRRHGHRRDVEAVRHLLEHGLPAARPPIPDGQIEWHPAPGPRSSVPDSLDLALVTSALDRLGVPSGEGRSLAWRLGWLEGHVETLRGHHGPHVAGSQVQYENGQGAHTLLVVSSLSTEASERLRATFDEIMNAEVAEVQTFEVGQRRPEIA